MVVMGQGQEGKGEVEAWRDVRGAGRAEEEWGDVVGEGRAVLKQTCASIGACEWRSCNGVHEWVLQKGANGWCYGAVLPQSRRKRAAR